MGTLGFTDKSDLPKFIGATSGYRTISESFTDQSKLIDFVGRLSGYGTLSEVHSDVFRGINHIGASLPTRPTRENYGITFFTRPDLNLSYNNVAGIRSLTPLLSDDDLSVARAIRSILDPRSNDDGIKSALADSESPFIPLFTNSIESMSGWPDIVVDAFTSKAGPYRDAWSMVDSTAELNGVYDFTVNFRNTVNDPLLLLVTAWVIYSSMVYTNRMVAYPDNIIERRIDYQTNCYRLVLDETRKYVTGIATWGAGFPTASPMGARFNFTGDTPFNTDTDQISIPFRVNSIRYMDPRSIFNFNTLVGMRNRNMRDGLRNSNSIKIGSPFANVALESRKIDPSLASNYFNYKASPRIDPYTMELEWWVSARDFNELLETEL